MDQRSGSGNNVAAMKLSVYTSTTSLDVGGIMSEILEDDAMNIFLNYVITQHASDNFPWSSKRQIVSANFLSKFYCRAFKSHHPIDRTFQCNFNLMLFAKRGFSISKKCHEQVSRNPYQTQTIPLSISSSNASVVTASTSLGVVRNEFRTM